MGAPMQESTPLRERWQQLREADPKLRIRNAAEQLGVTELALLRTDPERVRALRPDFPTIFEALRGVGPVMTLARNNEVVHETTGELENFHHNPRTGMALSTGALDLRLFFNRWRHACAVEEGERASLQCFDAAGNALYKIYRTEATNDDAWHRLIACLADPVSADVPLEAVEPPEPRRLCTDPVALRHDWSRLRDLHHFHGLPRRHETDRLSALEAVGEDWARPLPVGALERLLQAVADDTPIMAFVYNPGTVQIFSGEVHKLARTGPWYNVLDPAFNLHVRTEALAQCWRVRRPSADGDVNALDCFNHEGRLVLSLFGARKPGKPELTAWRAHLDALEAACAA